MRVLFPLPIVLLKVTTNYMAMLGWHPRVWGECRMYLPLELVGLTLADSVV